MDPFLLVSLIGLALIDSTSFGTLVIPLIMLAQPRVRPARVVLYLIALGVFYLGLGVLVLSGATWVRDVLTGAENALQSTAAYVVQAILGVGLVALSFFFDAPRVARRRAARGDIPTRRETWQKAAMGEHATRRAVIVLALIVGVAESAMMLPYLAAIGILTSSGVSVTVGTLVLTGYVAVMLLPAVVALTVRMLAGRRIDRLMTILVEWVRKHSAGATAWILGIVGVLLVLDAARVLVERGVVG